MIGIIGAMDTEVDNIKAQVKGKTVSEVAGVEFVCGFIEDVTVCVAKCSPGKVNAALCAQAMIDNFDIETAFTIGRTPKADIIKATYADFDKAAAGWKKV